MTSLGYVHRYDLQSMPFRGTIKGDLRNLVWLCSLVTMLFAGCSRPSDEQYLATRRNPARSPSGKFLLRVTAGATERARFQTFEIEELGYTGPHRIFSPTERFMSRHTTFFLWDDADRVWVYSGDVGTYFWVRVTNNVWEKCIYAQNQHVPSPDFLKRKYPQWH